MIELSNEKIEKNIENGYVCVEQKIKVEFFFSVEEFNRLERIVEAYNKNNDNPTSICDMQLTILNFGCRNSKRVEFNKQKFELELGLRDKIDWDTLDKYD